MPAIELAAKSVDEARSVAADRLGVPADRLTVTVLEETKGLFGKTQVRVRIETTEAAAPAAPAPVETKKPEPKPKAETSKVAPPKAEEPVVEEAPAAKPERGGRGRGRGKAAAPKAEETPVAAPVTETPAPEAQVEAVEERAEIVATPEHGEKLAGLLRELLEAAGIDATVAVGEIQGRYVSLAIGGKDASHIVGKHGEVLNALQYLVNVVASRRFADGVKANLDGNDFRKKREESLTRMAQRLAREVIDRQEEVVFDPLPAFERRIVHNVIAAMDGVKTYSEGEEPNRRVVISPAD